MCVCVCVCVCWGEPVLNCLRSAPQVLSPLCFLDVCCWLVAGLLLATRLLCAVAVLRLGQWLQRVGADLGFLTHNDHLEATI